MVKRDQSQPAELVALGAKLGVDEDVIEASAFVVMTTVSDSVKTTTISKGSKPPPGTHGYVIVEPVTKTRRTRSIKLSNLVHADMGTIIEVVAGGMVTALNIVAQPHPIIIAAGLLMVIRSFTRAMTVEFSEREASVFWGLIQACDRKKVATFDAAVERTNEVRNEVGLTPLSGGEIKLALRTLELIKCIRPVKNKQGTWRIRERWWKESSTSPKREWGLVDLAH